MESENDCADATCDTFSSSSYGRGCPDLGNSDGSETHSNVGESGFEEKSESGMKSDCSENNPKGSATKEESKDDSKEGDSKSSGIGAESQADESAVKLKEVEEKLKELESRLKSSETRANEAETRVKEVEEKLKESEDKLKSSETRANEAETRVKEVEEKLKESEDKLKSSETRANEAETRVKEVEEKLKESEDKLKNSETRANEAEAKVKEAEDKRKESSYNKHDYNSYSSNSGSNTTYTEKEINEKLENIVSNEQKLFSEVREMHKLYHNEFSGRLKSMQEELDGYHNIDKGRAFDNILSQIGRIYVNNETLADEVDDPKAKKNISYMLADIEELLDEYGMKKIHSEVGDKRNPRHCQVKSRIYTSNKDQHDTVAKSYGSGFYIENRTIIKEIVDVYIYDKNASSNVVENNGVNEAE